MKLELTDDCSLNDFLLFPSLIFDKILSSCVYVCVLEWFWISLTVIFPLCVSVCFGDFFCLCVW